MCNDFQKLIKDDLVEVRKIILSFADTDNEKIKSAINDYLSAPSKLLRPSLCCLFQKALYKKKDEKVLFVAAALELAHNASLLHDDVIDEAEMRRGDESFNKKFGDKAAILTGDLLLSRVMMILNSLNNQQLYALFADAIKNMITGELVQFYNKYKYPTLEDYYKKNYNKTGQLFKIAVLSPMLIQADVRFSEKAEKFAYYFANAFQIADDISDYFELSKGKPTQNDAKQGIYTLPDILTKSGYSANLYEECCKILKHQVNLSLESLDFISDNVYKEAIVSLCLSLLKDKNIEF